MQSRLLHNRWFGKFIGVMAAWVLAPTDPVYLPSAIIAGAALGHGFDYWAWYQSGSPRLDLPYLNQHSLNRASPHLRFMFAAFGAIAKSGGTVRATHIRYADSIMNNMGFNARSKAQAIEWFDQGKRGTFDFDAAARACLNDAAEAEELRATTLGCMCDITAVHSSDAARAELDRHAAILGFTSTRTAAELARAEEHLTAHGNRATSTMGNPSAESSHADTGELPSAVRAAYHCLDIREGASVATAKRAYRRMVARYHPDRLPKHATLTQHDYANARMVEFREALETLEAHWAPPVAD